MLSLQTHRLRRRADRRGQDPAGRSGADALAADPPAASRAVDADHVRTGRDHR
jgi:hypothetical protein